MIKIKLSKTNCYLFKLTEGYMLLDTGYEYDKKLFLKRLKQNRITIDEIRYIFLTHHHDDHAGLLTFLVEQNSSICVIMHNDCAYYLTLGVNDKTHGGGYMNRIVNILARLYKCFNKKWTFSFPKYITREIDHIIKTEDDKILDKIGLNNSKILFTPGHTSDSVSLLINKNCYIGDSAMNWLKWTGTPYATVFITNIDSYYNSWKKIINSDPQLLYPSHGEKFNIDKLKKNIYKIRQNQLVSFF